jgi:hypothetical protein
MPRNFPWFSLAQEPFHANLESISGAVIQLVEHLVRNEKVG